MSTFKYGAYVARGTEVWKNPTEYSDGTPGSPAIRWCIVDPTQPDPKLGARLIAQALNKMARIEYGDKKRHLGPIKGAGLAIETTAKQAKAEG